MSAVAYPVVCVHRLSRPYSTGDRCAGCKAQVTWCSHCSGYGVTTESWSDRLDGLCPSCSGAGVVKS